MVMLKAWQLEELLMQWRFGYSNLLQAGLYAMRFREFHSEWLHSALQHTKNVYTLHIS